MANQNGTASGLDGDSAKWARENDRALKQREAADNRLALEARAAQQAGTFYLETLRTTQVTQESEIVRLNGEVKLLRATIKRLEDTIDLLEITIERIRVLTLAEVEVIEYLLSTKPIVNTKVS